MAESTIGASWKLKNALVKLKIHPTESYESVIWMLFDYYKKKLKGGGRVFAG